MLKSEEISYTPLIFCVLGATSLTFVSSGIICSTHYALDSWCSYQRNFTGPIYVIGIATLLPICMTFCADLLDKRALIKRQKRYLSQYDVERVEYLSNHAIQQYNALESISHTHRLRFSLYSSHFLSAWGDRMWQFAIPILFIEIFVNTLLPSAIFSMVMYIGCVFAMPYVGQWVDTTNRLKVMKYSIWFENFFVILSACIMGGILFFTHADGIVQPHWSWQLIIMFLVVLISGALGQILNNTQTLSLERDWVVLIAKEEEKIMETLNQLALASPHTPFEISSEKEKEDENTSMVASNILTSYNTVMRRIDLGCKLLGPMAFGLLVDFAGDTPTIRAATGAAVVAIWNLLSLPLEWTMIRDVYYMIPALSDTKSKNSKQSSPSKTRSSSQSLCKQWKRYFQHPIFLISFSFCSLYMTVLDGGPLNTGYLRWRGITSTILGAARGAGAFFGLLGTMIFSYIVHHGHSIERMAVIFIWLFLVTLIPVLVCFWIEGETRVSDYTMLGSMILSRCWLWCVDLSEVQIMQEWVEPNKRGRINAMQTATHQIFRIVIQFLGIVCSNPTQFMDLVMFSIISVFCASVGFTTWYGRFGHRREYIIIKSNDSITQPFCESEEDDVKGTTTNI